MQRGLNAEAASGHKLVCIAIYSIMLLKYLLCAGDPTKVTDIFPQLSAQVAVTLTDVDITSSSKKSTAF